MIRVIAGFTWIELVITLVIIGILAAIAIPAYQDYKRRSYYSNVVQATAPYRSAVEECVQKLKTLTGCDAGAHAIPAAITTPKGVVNSLEVKKGIITATPIAAYGVAVNDTYVLTPIFNSADNKVTWASSGGGVAKGYANE